MLNFSMSCWGQSAMSEIWFGFAIYSVTWLGLSGISATCTCTHCDSVKMLQNFWRWKKAYRLLNLKNFPFTDTAIEALRS